MSQQQNVTRQPLAIRKELSHGMITGGLQLDPISMIRPRRKIVGMSAILLPFKDENRSTFDNVDWPGFDAHVIRTFEAGLVPAVNMDTGYANLIDDKIRNRVLSSTRTIASGRDFIAGAFVADNQSDQIQIDAYLRSAGDIANAGGTPIIFQSFGLTQNGTDSMLDAYRKIGAHVPRFLAFELSPRFAPFGSIYSLEVYRELLSIPQCIGAKHSSLEREPEWRRLVLRDSMRPDFKVLTGNDLAIDMVIYGSDYLLGLSTFCPDLFAIRDRMWYEGDSRFYQLNDLLQYLGCIAFRNPVPAYKHSAAMFLKLRGLIASDATHTASPRRPTSDLQVLENLWKDLERYV